jgi:hypothetical protein
MGNFFALCEPGCKCKQKKRDKKNQKKRKKEQVIILKKGRKCCPTNLGVSRYGLTRSKQKPKTQHFLLSKYLV